MITEKTLESIERDARQDLELEPEWTLTLIAEVRRLRAEVEMLRGVGCLEDGDGPCGCCVKCLPILARRAERERCAKFIADEGGDRYLVDAIRALPDEDGGGA